MRVGQFRTGSGTALFPNYYHFHPQNYAVPPGLAMGKQFEIRSTHVFLYVPLILFFCLLLCYRIKITQQVTSTGFLFPPFFFFNSHFEITIWTRRMVPQYSTRLTLKLNYLFLNQNSKLL